MSSPSLDKAYDEGGRPGRGATRRPGYDGMDELTDQRVVITVVGDVLEEEHPEFQDRHRGGPAPRGRARDRYEDESLAVPGVRAVADPLALVGVSRETILDRLSRGAR